MRDSLGGGIIAWSARLRSTPISVRLPRHRRPRFALDAEQDHGA
jgi:hypothetical protein